MGNPADWTEDAHNPLYYGGTMPEAYREDLPFDDDEAIGYEAAQPALQTQAWQGTC